MLPSLRAFALGAGVSVLVCLAAPLIAAPRLVADLNRGSSPENQPISLLSSGSDPAVYYFDGNDPAHGQELWRTDGTPEGTVRVSDVCPGPCGSSPGTPERAQGRLWFAADDGVSGRELWQSDGTPGSERPVLDICPGPCSSNPADLEALGDRLLFSAVAEGGRQLWITDGTRAGTLPLAPLCSNSSSACIEPGSFHALAGGALFSVWDDPLFGIWRTDGTPAGTRRLSVDLGTELAMTSPVVLLGGSGYFWTHHGLWRTDGSVAGTVQVKATEDLGIHPFETGVVATPMTAWNGTLYAFVGVPAVLVVSDGTPAGTFSSGPPAWQWSPVALPSGVLYATSSGEGDDSSLMLLRGPDRPAEKVFGAHPGRFFDGLLAVGDHAYFFFQRGDDQGYDFWVTDGTAAGTRKVDEGPPGVGISEWVPRANGQLLTTEGWAGAHTLWRRRLDGTEPRLLRDFDATAGGSGPRSQAVLGRRLLFSAQVSATEAPLFVSDGTPDGTRLLRSDVPWASQLTPVGRRLYFTSAIRDADPQAYPSFIPNGVWATDGTAQGTVLRARRDLSVSSVAALGKELFLSAGPARNGVDLELWRTNGRPEGMLVRHIDRERYAGSHQICYRESSAPGPWVVIGSRLVFAAGDGRDGRELWITDGTTAGTRLLRDINLRRESREPDGECDSRKTNGFSSSPDGFLSFTGGALFAADDGRTGRELWWTDGTAEGTRRVADVLPGPNGSSPRELTALGAQAYFFITDPEDGDQLWRTDGTAAGTALVHDLKMNGERSWAHGLTAAGDKLFFSVYNEATGAELWSSEGDARSTGLVADLRPGAAGSYPQSLTAVGGVLVFAATDGASGLEPWRSDGTAAGTRRLGDIDPGPGASAPGPFSRIGDELLTGASDGVHGRELWAIPMADVVP